MTDPSTFLPTFVSAVCLVAYFLPTLSAFYREHPSRWPIFWVNLFLGFTLLGWIICMFWALSEISRGIRRANVGTAMEHRFADEEDEKLLQLRTLLSDGVITENEYDVMRQTPLSAQS